MRNSLHSSVRCHAPKVWHPTRASWSPIDATLSKGVEDPAYVSSPAHESRAYHVNPSPWDSLPGDHFVASCALIEFPISAATPTTRCSDVVSFVAVNPDDFAFVDDEGRTTPIRYASLEAPNLCASSAAKRH